MNERRTTEPELAHYWWREWEVLWLVLLIVGIYFSRLTTLTIRGEESRRARVACEMLESGDWIVPRLQGQTYISRPPLGSWLIALVALARGDVDMVAVRLPTALATLFTSLLVYGYSRTFLSRVGSLAAGLAYASMGQVLQLGRLAETEATFTFFVSSSLLVWHWGFTHGWRPALTWTAGYGLAALASLAKGPQGPVYFAGPVVIYLLLRREWRQLLSWPHALGAALFIATIAAWQVPYWMATDLDSVRGTWFKLAVDRFVDTSPHALLLHLAMFPCEVIGCMLPWSPLLIRFCDRGFVRQLGMARPHFQFLATAIGVTFPTVWFAGGAIARYYMPLYPCFAVLIGLVIDRTLAEDPASVWRRAWNHSLEAIGLAGVSCAMVIALASSTTIAALAVLAQPLPFAGGYLVAALVVAGLLFRYSRLARPSARVALIAMSGLVGLSYTGALLNVLDRMSENTGAAVARLKDQLPSSQPLVSFGPVDHLFAFHYREPIRLQHWPDSTDDVNPELEYFCFNARRAGIIPFPWQTIAVVSLERNKTDQPHRAVVVGRRLPVGAETPHDPDRTRQTAVPLQRDRE